MVEPRGGWDEEPAAEPPPAWAWVALIALAALIIGALVAGAGIR